MAIQIGLGNLAGGKFTYIHVLFLLTWLTCTAMASNFYRGQDAPKYILGHALELGFCVVGMIAVVVLRFSYQRINRNRDQMDLSKYDEAEMEKMGDRSPTFRYML
jgi:hypothetical protein